MLTHPAALPPNRLDPPRPVRPERYLHATPEWPHDADAPEAVLLVEDDAGVRAVTRLMLESSGYHVMEAADGEEALAIARGHSGPLHLLLTDAILPRMRGRQLAERLAALHPKAAVLYISGYPDSTLLERGALDEAADLLRKPFTRLDLAAKVREVLDRKASGPPNVGSTSNRTWSRLGVARYTSRVSGRLTFPTNRPRLGAGELVALGRRKPCPINSSASSAGGDTSAPMFPVLP